MHPCIQHPAPASSIQHPDRDADTGSLNLIASTKVQVQGVNGETMAIFNEDGGVELRHNDVKKFETTSAGATVSGTLGVTGVVTANAGVVVDNITIDGTEIDLSSGSLTVDSAANITLDCGTGELNFANAGTTIMQVQADSSHCNFIQKVQEIRIDDDQDSIWITVDIGDGASCHVGYRSCFYRSIPLGPIDNGRKIQMKFEEKEKVFDPEDVYKNQPNPTKI